MNRNSPQKKIYSLDEAREKVRAFCAYRERSQVEVREKLLGYGIIPDVAEVLITELIQGNFLNEERFARAYVRGKFSIKKWGRQKIKQGLYHHHLSDYVLRKAFEEIDEQQYMQTLESVVEKKMRDTKISNEFQRNGKVAAYAISRGFEPDLVWECVKRETRR